MKPLTPQTSLPSPAHVTAVPMRDARHALRGWPALALSTLAVASLLSACGAPHQREATQPVLADQARASEAAASPVPTPVPTPTPAPVATPAHAGAPRPALAMTRQRSGLAAMPQAMPGAAVPPQRPTRALPARDSERYDAIHDNPVKLTVQQGVSTLSLDVDTGSYSNVRRFLKQGRLPPADAVRVEELLNYFPFQYANEPTQGAPFGVTTEVAPAPWNARHLLLRVGVKAVDAQSGQMPPANLVFLVDVSGSMQSADKLPLVQAALRMLTEQLRPQDTVSIVTYSGKVELALPATNDKQKILGVVGALQASGATAGGQALAMAYEQARAAFKRGGINRILMATDGDFNLGVADVQQLKSMVARERRGGVSLTTLGFGQGNFNEPMMQQLAQVGNGNYSYIDSATEARKVLREELSSTFNTVAADVKLQIEFNPATVAEWRLIGYENRLLNEADFRNDQVDAVEIGAGKSVTALYELTPVGQPTLHAPRRYGPSAASARQGSAASALQGSANELGEWRVRYKAPGQSAAREISQPVTTHVTPQPSADWQFAAAVAGFGQLLRTSPYIGAWNYDDALALARAGRGADAQGYRAEFAQLVDTARSLAPKAVNKQPPQGHLQAP